MENNAISKFNGYVAQNIENGRTYQTNEPNALTDCAHPADESVDEQEESQGDHRIRKNL